MRQESPLELPYTGEVTMSETTGNALAILAGLALVVVTLLLSGCASWGDYAAEVRVVNEKIAADRKADREREAKEDAGIGAALANPALTPPERIAIAGFWAMTKMRGGGSTKEGPGYIAVQPPPDPLDGVVKVASIVVPTAGNVAMAFRQARTAERQSDNAARTAESSNAAMVALGTTGARVAGDVATAAVNQIPNLRPSLTFTIGRDGTIGDGTFTQTLTNQALTTGGDGILGPGTITRPANPSRVCTVSATGVVSCAP